MKVSDLMSEMVVTVSPETPLNKVNRLLHRYRLNNLVVVDEQKKVLGIVTLSDLFRQVLPTYDQLEQNESYWYNPDSIEDNIVDLVSKPVKDVMNKNVMCIAPDDHAVKAGALMVAHRFKQLPVVEADRLVGIISYEDITWGYLLKNCKYF